MAAAHFTNLNTDQGLAHLNKHLEHVSYVDGWVPTQSDATLFGQVHNVDAKKYPHVARWHKHVSSFSADEQKAFGPADHSLHHHSHDHHHEAKKEEAAPAPAKKEAAPAAAEDEIDLFGEEDPEKEAEHERILEERRKAHEAKKAASGKVVIAKSSVIFDVKPWDDQTDLGKMEEAVRSITMEGLHWGAAKLVPIAFGVKKLQIIATIVDDLVSTDDMIDQMQAFEELVQSVDIAAFNKL